MSSRNMPAEMNGNEPCSPVEDLNECSIIGLTKREHFAALAMNGLLSGLGYESGSDNPSTTACCARTAVKYADALLDALAAVKP